MKCQSQEVTSQATVYLLLTVEPLSELTVRNENHKEPHHGPSYCVAVSHFYLKNFFEYFLHVYHILSQYTETRK